jgi:hypothetical protein
MTDDADAVLGTIIARLRAVPGALETVADKLAPEVQAYLADCYRRGVDPDGEPWPPTATGQQPAITGSSLAVAAVGKRVIVKLRWHDALHSLGQARGGRTRRLVPAGAIPPRLAERMQTIVRAELRRALTGGGK